MSKTKENSDEKVTVFIPIDRTGDEGDTVYVSVNGNAMLVPRGQQVEIPKAYAEVLRLADKERGAATQFIKKATEKADN